MKQQPYIQLNPSDQVAVALRDLACGSTVNFNGNAITLKADIPFGHKFALKPVTKGQNVLKYGLPIGHATCDIAEGELVHTHNLTSNYQLKQ